MQNCDVLKLGKNNTPIRVMNSAFNAVPIYIVPHRNGFSDPGGIKEHRSTSILSIRQAEINLVTRKLIAVEEGIDETNILKRFLVRISHS